MKEFIDAYAELEVSASADQAELAAAYRALARRRHPDAVGPAERPAATERMQRLNLAYGLVAESETRRAYDRIWRAHQAGRLLTEAEQQWAVLLRRAGRWVGAQQTRRGGPAYRLGRLTGRLFMRR